MRFLRSGVLLAGLAVCGATALGEEPTVPPVELDARADWIAGADLNSAGSRLSQSAYLFDLSFPVAGGKHWGVGVDLVDTVRQFRFEHFESFVPGAQAPFYSANDLSLQPTLALMPDKCWTVLLGSAVEYAGASGAKFDDSRLIHYSAAALCELNPELKLGFGFQLRQRFPQHRYLQPFPLIEWHSGRWSLTAMDGDTGRISFAITSQTDIYTQIEFRSFDIRFAPASPLAAGMLHYDGFPAVLGVHIQVNKHFTLSVSSGLALGQQFRFEDRTGRFLKESDVSSPFCGNFEADWSF